MSKRGVKTKAEEALLESRVLKVLNWILAGISPYRIVQMVSREGENWGVTERTIWNYIRRANEKFAQEAIRNQKEQFGKAVFRLNSLYSQCLLAQDYRTCLAIQIEINKLFGLYAPEVLEIRKVTVQDTLQKINEYKKLIANNRTD